MRLVLVFLTCMCISFSAPQNALSFSPEDIYESWILTDVENNMQEEGWIGIMKHNFDKDLLTFDYGRYKDEGSYSLSNDTLKLTPPFMKINFLVRKKPMHCFVKGYKKKTFMK